ncbi:hypothetical protein OsJ_12189 [Oryza sativa Japonica Group]|uniref:Uncharacterized protein n=1 Tax=Oryza sativa subsp. japonica TaxID=39947 RepID=A3ALM8_ORYSJ|nr:hypothetical protein OsJ_12189 [Oryza sativa Japonica Group]
MEGDQQCRAGHGWRPATTPSSLGMGSGGGGGGRMRQSDRGIKRSLAAIDPAPSLKKEVKDKAGSLVPPGCHHQPSLLTQRPAWQSKLSRETCACLVVSLLPKPPHRCRLPSSSSSSSSSAAPPRRRSPRAENSSSPPPHKNATLSEILPRYGLPPGLFPASVTAFSLAANGSLAVDLGGPCYAHYEYLTYFEPRVTGVLRYGSLTGLSGVKVRRFLVWFDVVRVKVDLPPPPRYVYLDIGWITRKLPADEFESPHECEDSKKCRLSSALATVAAWFQV